eukprot:CAMPEP_0172319014 /NCGR_PEP_ID=MMETSP1058-20130122/36519_1 /TAXON_ID=83371 /ORGANISM="Detonula confervacea, Strain CCMP 353" /LENGTH=514 /DNA_ID=CAMNT_0013033957 /DNA_START=335 /DNA_END=1879 /DNA_ORIENTATION=-
MSGATNQSSFLEEVIPESLRSLYSQEQLQFPVTKSMLRQSRPIIGNNQRLHFFLKKLQKQQCTTVVFMGGSITRGHGAGGPSKAYPPLFVQWLNEQYPCLNNNNGTRGVHIGKRTTAQNSQTSFIGWPLDHYDEIDLVLLEFNVNDAFIPDLPHALEDKGWNEAMMEYKSGWYYEAILRRLLLLRKPDPVAIITFNADYNGDSWLNNTEQPRRNIPLNRKKLFRDNNEPMKIWLSSLYEIPVISASIWLLPLASKQGLNLQFSPNRNPYSTTSWHVENDSFHPRHRGHLVLALVLAYNIIEEEKIMLNDSQQVADIERDFSAEKSLLRDPVYLSPEEDDTYIRARRGGQDLIDFTDSGGEANWRGRIVANDGWTWMADNKDKDKFGIISDDKAGGQHFAVKITGGKHGIVEVSFVISYVNFGIAIAWLDDQPTNLHSDECKEEIHANLPVARGEHVTQRLIAVWDEHVSVPTVNILRHRLHEGDEATLHFCLTPHSYIRHGEGNKFKLLGVRVF